MDKDPKRLAHYPYPSHCGDVVTVMETLLSGGSMDFTDPITGEVEWLTLADFVAVHASPTCTGYSRGTVAIPDRATRYDRLIAVTRALLVATGLPYVIENVADARRELIQPTMLCWSMFHTAGSVTDTDGTPLRMERHRLFEANFTIVPPAGCYHPKNINVAGAYGGARRDKYEAKHVRKGGYVPPNLDVLRALTGLPHATERGCFLSIPPSYTEHVANQLLAALPT